MLNIITNSLFYAVSAIAVISALMVISAKNPVRSVLFLVLTFVATSASWILIEAEFLAITLILVYVGAVLVLFLFIVMMLDVEIAAIKAQFIRYLPAAILVSVTSLIMLVLVLGPQEFGAGKEITLNAATKVSNVEKLGIKLYEDYIFEVQVAGLILLTAMIAAISLTFRGARSRKSQQVSKQVEVKKSDRLKIINMPFEDYNGRSST